MGTTASKKKKRPGNYSLFKIPVGYFPWVILVKRKRFFIYLFFVLHYTADLKTGVFFSPSDFHFYRQYEDFILYFKTQMIEIIPCL